MHGTRERLRRALSVVVLGCAFVVLVATSGPADDTITREIPFDEVSFDAKTEVVEGTIGPSGDLPAGWNSSRTVTVDVATRREERLLVEVLDPSGAVLASSLQRATNHQVIAHTRCAEVPCGEAATYRVQSLGGGSLSVLPLVTIEFEASEPDQPDVEVDAPAPSVRPRNDAVRGAVLASTELTVTSAAPVAAAQVSWTSASCTKDRPPRLALVSVVSPGSDWEVMTIDRPTIDDPPWSEDDGVFYFETPSTQALDIDCRAMGNGRVRHSAWAVLHSVGQRVVAEIAVLGRPEHPVVQMTPASVEASRVDTVRGGDERRVRHEVTVPGDPSAPLDASTVYLLAAEAPFQEPDLVGLANTEDCRRCVSLEISVILDSQVEETRGDLEAEVFVYEISVP